MDDQLKWLGPPKGLSLTFFFFFPQAAIPQPSLGIARARFNVIWADNHHPHILRGQLIDATPQAMRGMILHRVARADLQNPLRRFTSNHAIAGPWNFDHVTCPTLKSGLSCSSGNRFTMYAFAFRRTSTTLECCQNWGIILKSMMIDLIKKWDGHQTTKNCTKLVSKVPTHCVREGCIHVSLHMADPK